MKHSTKLLVIIATAVSTLAFAGVGWAFWSTTGNGSASGRAGTLNAPTAVTPSSTAGSSTVAVTWTAPTGGVAPTGYYVYRTTGATTTAACTSPVALRPPTPTSCSDTGVPNGTYTYKVTAVFQSWTAQSVVAGGPVTVSTGPTVTSVLPTSRGQGAVSQAIAITGAGFVSGATASFSGTGIAVNSTTFNSATSVTANITIATGAAAPTGARNVTVTNPDAGTGTLTNGFTVNTGPTVTSVLPTSRGQGAVSQAIAITGTGFVSGATASFSGTGIAVNSTTFNSATSVTANITIATGAAAPTGARNVTVTNPDAGTGTLTNGFTVNTGPTVTSVLPTSRGQGAVSQAIAITGTGFVSGATASFSGTGIAVNSTTFNSATSVTANITIATGAAAPTGARNVTVTNPNAGTGTLTNGFTVNTGPTITSINPTTQAKNSTSPFTVNGSGFVSGATLALSGGDMTYTVTSFSSTQIVFNVTLSSNATKSARDVIVTNPDGGTATAPAAFTVT